MNDHNDQLIAKTTQSSTKQISHIVNDDIVVVKDVPSDPQPSEGTKKSKRIKRGNKKNKKKDKGGEATLDLRGERKVGRGNAGQEQQAFMSHMDVVN